jgi:hypothetical protein
VVSKGVSYYAHVSAENWSVAFTGPKVGQTFQSGPVMQSGSFEIDSKNIPGITNYTGRFQFTASGPPGSVQHHEDISSLYGSMQGGDLEVMLSTPSEGSDDLGYSVSYGFYDAGSGADGMTNRDQCYVYATPSYESWMKDFSGQPLSSLVLPGAHDAGMFDTSTLDAVLNSSEAEALFDMLGLLGPALHYVSAGVARTVLVNLAFTQKDTTTTMLDLGIRYFDVRPGYLTAPLNQVRSDLYHQHNFVPGASFEAMLVDIFRWLVAHPTEVVVLTVGAAGFADPAQMTPDAPTLANYVQAAQRTVGSTFTIGGLNSLSQSVGDLARGGTQLVLLDRVHSTIDVYDSYSDAAYQTLDVTSIINALAGMTGEEQQKHDYTVLQLQGTASGTSQGIASQIPPKSYAASPLMATKGAFDSATYPWALQHVPTNLGKGKLLVLLNDYADNALVDCAIQLSTARL